MARPTRRSTKHRGNAAGMIEARGRTGRKPRPSETRSTSGRGAKSSAPTRRGRHDRPPSWKSAGGRAVVAAVIVFVVSALLIKQGSIASKVILFPIVLAIYMPLIYYTDQFMYRRAQRKRAAGR